MSCVCRAKCSRCGCRSRGPLRVSSRCARRRSTRGAKPCKSSLAISWCPAGRSRPDSAPKLMRAICYRPPHRRLHRSKYLPFARIDLIKGKPSDYRRTIGDIVYKAMVEILKAPENDRFQVINEHDADNFVYDPTFFGIERSADLVFVQLTLVEGRTLEQKRAFYKQVVDELNQRLKLRREDVFISLVGTGREDWSFGNGEPSLVKP